MSLPGLCQVFQELKLEEYFDLFVKAGYENYEIILAQFNTKYGISKEVIVSDIGVQELRVIKKILNRISNDFLIYKPTEIVFEE